MATMGEGPPVLRPLGIADILDVALRLYRHNFRAFLGITAVVLVPIGVLQTVGGYFMGRTMGVPTETTPEPDLTAMGTYFGFLGLAAVLSLLAMPICQGALSIAVARRYLGQPVSVADAYNSIGGRWGPLVAGVLLAGLMAFFGTLACIVPGVYLAIIFMFVTPVIAVEGLPLMEALRRSADLVRGEWWRCFGTYLLLGFLVQLVAGASIAPVTIFTTLVLMERDPALAQAITQGLSMAVSLFAQPVQITGIVLLYYDLRVRKEGFDLELLAQSLGTKVSPGLVGSATWSHPAAPPPPVSGAPLPPRVADVAPPSATPLPPRLDEETPPEPPATWPTS